MSTIPPATRPQVPLESDQPPLASPISGKRVRCLDGLRGIAVIMVLGIHFLNSKALPQPPPRLNSLPHIFAFGWMGVDLFLVLSGFLITGILVDTRGEPHFLRNFYARRALRIFPLYYLVVVTAFATAPLQRRHPQMAPYVPDHTSWIYYFLYLINWFIPFSSKATGYFSLYWTLAIEEQFYLFWPVLVAKLRPRTFTTVCLAICMLVPLLRIALGLHSSASQFTFTNTFTRMDSLGWGALAAIILRSPEARARVKPLLFWVASTCCIIVLFIDFPLHDFYTRGFPTQSVGFTVIAIGFSCLLLMAYDSELRQGKLASLLRWGVFTHFGRYSYGMYIFHSLILIAMELVFQRYAWFGYSFPLGLALFVFFFGVCYAVGGTSFHLFEKHFLRLKVFFEIPSERKPLW